MKPSPADYLERERRLEALLAFEGKLSRGRLIGLLDLSETRASEVLRAFREAHPDWTYWDPKGRCWRATTVAQRKLTAVHASARLFTSYLGLTGLDHCRPGSEATACAAFSDAFSPDPRVFAALREAIESRAEVSITYRSMRNPEPHERRLIPHTLVRAGRRWHVRAFCIDHHDFRDFALGRIAKVVKKALAAEPAADPKNDAAWQTTVTVMLVPHPRLTHPQQQVIRAEFMGSAAARGETCRGALVEYLVQDMRAAVDVTKQLPPEYQLAVENMDVVRPWLFRAA